MHIEQIRPAVYQITIHGYELATLMAAARWVLEGTEGELSPEARQQLEQVVKGYDDGFRRLHTK